MPRISFSIDPQNDFSLSFDWQEAKKYKQEILDLPERIAEEKKLQFVICIDEFQRIAEFKESNDLEKRLRSSWQ